MKMGFWKKCKEYVDILDILLPPPVWLIWKLISTRITKETRRIVILGCQGSGKTELWCRLRGIQNQEKGGTGQEQIEEFELGQKEDGTSVVVLTTKDIGGGNLWVREYNNLINEDRTCIFYLINLQRFELEREDNQRRLRKITSIISNEKFEKCGLILVATFYDKCGKSRKEIQTEVQSMLREIKMMKKASEIPIEIINTTNDNDVKIIKKEIFKSLES